MMADMQRLGAALLKPRAGLTTSCIAFVGMIGARSMRRCSGRSMHCAIVFRATRSSMSEPKCRRCSAAFITRAGIRPHACW
jgi:hypothetical protein